MDGLPQAHNFTFPTQLVNELSHKCVHMKMSIKHQFQGSTLQIYGPKSVLQGSLVIQLLFDTKISYNSLHIMKVTLMNI